MPTLAMPTGIVPDLVNGLISGIVFFFAFRHSTESSTRGQFLVLFTELMLVVVISHVVTEYVFAKSRRPTSRSSALRRRRFEGFTWMFQTIMQTLSTYMLYVLVQQIRGFGDKRFLDGPFSFIQMAAVMCIIVAVRALMFIFIRYGDPQPDDVAALVSYIRAKQRMSSTSAVSPRPHIGAPR